MAEYGLHDAELNKAATPVSDAAPLPITGADLAALLAILQDIHDAETQSIRVTVLS